MIDKELFTLIKDSSRCPARIANGTNGGLKEAAADNICYRYDLRVRLAVILGRSHELEHAILSIAARERPEPLDIGQRRGISS